MSFSHSRGMQLSKYDVWLPYQGTNWRRQTWLDPAAASQHHQSPVRPPAQCLRRALHALGLHLHRDVCMGITPSNTKTRHLVDHRAVHVHPLGGRLGLPVLRGLRFVLIHPTMSRKSLVTFFTSDLVSPMRKSDNTLTLRNNGVLGHGLPIPAIRHRSSSSSPTGHRSSRRGCLLWRAL